MIRRGVASLVILAVASMGIAAGLLVVNAIGANCHYAQKQWDTSHALIIDQTKVQPASPILLKIPEFAPFFTPGTPEYAEAARIQREKRRSQFKIQGSRPSC